ncbi:Hypothetical_protein [Hexamita inflata]|uniref:Hypothetical_protein n=1 Tax=Hexamita inflata TaxID=28002 RepID=A0AA86UT61_9EUKA|nr:Hypothetical protein HINF_LOCUS51331 [Hexamita inflata]
MRRRSGKTNSEKRKQSSAMATVWRIPEAYFFSQGIYDNIQVAGVHFAGIHKGFLDSCCKCACGVGFRTLSTPENVYFRRNGRCGRLSGDLTVKLVHLQYYTSLLGFATEFFQYYVNTTYHIIKVYPQVKMYNFKHFNVQIYNLAVV